MYMDECLNLYGKRKTVKASWVRNLKIFWAVKNPPANPTNKKLEVRKSQSGLRFFRWSQPKLVLVKVKESLSYELELVRILDTILLCRYDEFINIGLVNLEFVLGIVAKILRV